MSSDLNNNTGLQIFKNFVNQVGDEVFCIARSPRGMIRAIKKNSSWSKEELRPFKSDLKLFFNGPNHTPWASGNTKNFISYLIHKIFENL